MQFVHADCVFPDLLRWGDELVAFRHEVHKTPELGFDTARTVERIVKTLKEWGIESVDTDLVAGGAIVVTEGTRRGQTVALRTDIDARGMNANPGQPLASCIALHAHPFGHGAP